MGPVKNHTDFQTLLVEVDDEYYYYSDAITTITTSTLTRDVLGGIGVSNASWNDSVGAGSGEMGVAPWLMEFAPKFRDYMVPIIFVFGLLGKLMRC
jgi:hypothetical protein